MCLHFTQPHDCNWNMSKVRNKLSFDLSVRILNSNKQWDIYFNSWARVLFSILEWFLASEVMFPCSEDSQDNCPNWRFNLKPCDHQLTCKPSLLPGKIDICVPSLWQSAHKVKLMRYSRPFLSSAVIDARCKEVKG